MESNVVPCFTRNEYSTCTFYYDMDGMVRWCTHTLHIVQFAILLVLSLAVRLVIGGDGGTEVMDIVLDEYNISILPLGVELGQGRHLGDMAERREHSHLSV